MQSARFLTLFFRNAVMWTCYNSSPHPPWVTQAVSQPTTSFIYPSAPFRYAFASISWLLVWLAWPLQISALSQVLFIAWLALQICFCVQYVDMNIFIHTHTSPPGILLRTSHWCKECYKKITHDQTWHRPAQNELFFHNSTS